MERFVPLVPPPAYGLPQLRRHGSHLEERRSLYDDDSGYWSADSDSVPPTTTELDEFDDDFDLYNDGPDQLRHWTEVPIDTHRYHASPWKDSELDQRKSQYRNSSHSYVPQTCSEARHRTSNIERPTSQLRRSTEHLEPLFRHVFPFHRPGRHTKQISKLSEAGLDPHEPFHLHPHEHKSRIPSALPSLGNRVKSDINSSSSASTTPARLSSQDPGSARKEKADTSSSSPSAASRCTPQSDPWKRVSCRSAPRAHDHDQDLATSWRELYQERRKLKERGRESNERERSIMKRQRQDSS